MLRNLFQVRDELNLGERKYPELLFSLYLEIQIYYILSEI